MIVGGAGFIGSAFANSLLESKRQNTQIVIFDNFSSGTLDHVKNLISNGVEIINGDLGNPDEIEDALTSATTVFHFAANPDIAKAVVQPDIDFWSGTFLTNNLIEAARKKAVAEVLYISGSGVYGENPKESFTEDYGPCFPISTYGASKLACEALLSAYSHMFEMKSRAFRFANVVGPRQTHGVGYDFLRKLELNPNVLEILGDGTQTKSYVHVQDIISAINVVWNDMRTGEDAFDVFNVSNDDSISVTEIAKMACETLSLEAGATEFKYTGSDRGWKGDVPKVRLDSSKIRKLGWIPKLNSRESVKNSILSMYQEKI